MEKSCRRIGRSRDLSSGIQGSGLRLRLKGLRSRNQSCDFAMEFHVEDEMGFRTSPDLWKLQFLYTYIYIYTYTQRFRASHGLGLSGC